jgi:hypothetical protein
MDHRERIFFSGKADHQADDERIMRKKKASSFMVSWFPFPWKTPGQSNGSSLSPLLALLLFVLTQNACFDPRDGCLDIAATNFNVYADKNCCCTFPNLTLTVDQVYDTLLFRQDSLYAGTGGHLFRIKSVAFYLSDFELFKNGTSFKMGDSLVLKTYDAANNDTINQIFTDDFTLIRRTPLNNEVASFREDGIFDAIKFRLGLNTGAEKIISALAPTSHPLRPQPENLSQSGYVFLQAIVVRDSMAATVADTLNFVRSDIGDFFIEGAGNFQHKTGYDFPMKLQADWKALFQGVVWTTNDISAWKTQIVANLPSVFSVSQ